MANHISTRELVHFTPISYLFNRKLRFKTNSELTQQYNAKHVNLLIFFNNLISFIKADDFEYLLHVFNFLGHAAGEYIGLFRE